MSTTKIIIFGALLGLVNILAIALSNDPLTPFSISAYFLMPIAIGFLVKFLFRNESKE
ncbi:hypothetical protein FHX35_001538 [Auritidibacter ignavus]|nr:hypothetical protein [Auritidibacter ignavus]